MVMTRQERISLHKKQERLQVWRGVPAVSELTEGVPALRDTDEGLVQYVKHKNVLYKKSYDQVVTGEEKASIYLGNLPDFDSGWVNVTINSEYEFIHWLGSKMLLQQWYFMDDSDNVFDLSSESLHEIINSPTDKDTGISIFMEGDFKISVGTGANIVFSHYGTDASETYVELTDGYLRCFLWKLNVAE